MEQKQGTSEVQSKQRLTRSWSSTGAETSMSRDKMSSSSLRNRPLSKSKSTLSDSMLFERKVTHVTTRTEKTDAGISKPAHQRLRKSTTVDNSLNRTTSKQDTANGERKNQRPAAMSGGTSLRRAKPSGIQSNTNTESSNGKQKASDQEKLPLVLNSWSGTKNEDDNRPVENRMLAIQERKEVIDKYLEDMRNRAKMQSSEMLSMARNDERNSPRGDNHTHAEQENERNKDAVPKLALEKLDEDNSDNNNDKSTNNAAKGRGRGWSLLRKKLVDVKEENTDETTNEVTTNEVTKKEDTTPKINDEESTAKYLKMLRERLRQCQPAEIIASSDVKEIAKRKQDLERRRSVSHIQTKKSFFETVLTAHALAKQGNVTNRSAESSRRTSRVNPANLSRNSLPDISSNKVKFHCSPHFSKTLRMMGNNDHLIKEEETGNAQDRPKGLTTRYTL